MSVFGTRENKMLAMHYIPAKLVPESETSRTVSRCFCCLFHGQ